MPAIVYTLFHLVLSKAPYKVYHLSLKVKKLMHREANSHAEHLIKDLLKLTFEPKPVSSLWVYFCLSVCFFNITWVQFLKCGFIVNEQWNRQERKHFVAIVG